MATITNQRGTVLQIVNDVQERMGYSPTATLSANRTSLKLLGFLNDVVQTVSDYGDWPQMYEEVLATAAVCSNTVEINASAPIKSIMEVHEGSAVSPLTNRDISQMRLLERTSAQGVPRQFAWVNTSGINPILRFSPWRTTTAKFNVAAYTSPLIYASGDTTRTPPFSRRLLVNGVYSLAMLDENDGVATQHYQANAMLFTNMLREEYSRSAADTGTDVMLVRPRN